MASPQTTLGETPLLTEDGTAPRRPGRAVPMLSKYTRTPLPLLGENPLLDNVQICKNPFRSSPWEELELLLL